MSSLLERQVQAQVKDWFGWHKWRCLRWNVGMAVGAAGGKVFFGEKGMPDLMFVYYVENHEREGASFVVWVETKKPGGKLSAKQIEWQTKEMMCGASVVTIDSFEQLREWYAERFGWLHRPNAPGAGQCSLDLGGQ